MHKLAGFQKGFQRWLNDPDSKIEVREGSRLYTSYMWRKGSRVECTETPHVDMVETMRQHFETHPEDFPVMSDDNLARRRIRFTTQDKRRSWEIGLHDVKLRDASIPERERDLLRTPEGREELALLWTQEWNES